MLIKIDPITCLPEDVVRNAILPYLEAPELGKFCRVSKTWNEVICDNDLWRKLFPTVSFPLEVDAKKYIDTHTVRSFDEVLERVKTFAHKIQLNQLGSFRCCFPLDSKREFGRYSVEAQLGFGEFSRNQVPHLAEVFLFMKKIPAQSRTYWPLGLSIADSKTLSVFAQTPNKWSLIFRGSLCLSSNLDADAFYWECGRLLYTRARELEKEALVHQNGRVIGCIEGIMRRILRVFK